MVAERVGASASTVSELLDLGAKLTGREAFIVAAPWAPDQMIQECSCTK